MNKSYLTRILRTDNPFYKEALKCLANIDRRKGVANVQDWDAEHLFYNPLIVGKTGKTITETEYFRRNGINKLGQLLEEKSKESRNLPFDKVLVKVANNIKLEIGIFDSTDIKTDVVFLGNKKEVKMRAITQKDLYEDAILKKSTDHIYQTKWMEKLNTLILWEEVWTTLHNFLLSNKTKTAIWEQIHLNFYTQYSYNKWHKVSQNCPLCNQIPQNIYHIILDCKFVNTIWNNIQPTLSKFHDKIIDNEEKSLGIVQIKRTPMIMLRNWITFKIREQILTYEKKAIPSRI